MSAGVSIPSVGAAQEAHQGKSAEEVAKELANPNNSLASLTFKNQSRGYTGDLPDANDQSNYTLKIPFIDGTLWQQRKRISHEHVIKSVDACDIDGCLSWSGCSSTCPIAGGCRAS